MRGHVGRRRTPLTGGSAALDRRGVLAILVDFADDGSGNPANDRANHGADAGDDAPDDGATDRSDGRATDLFAVAVALVDDCCSVIDGDFLGHGE
jgi:hypothetical protein